MIKTYVDSIEEILKEFSHNFGIPEHLNLDGA